MKRKALATVSLTLRLLGLCSIAAVLSIASVAQNYTFNLASAATGNNPQAVTNADLNGDTKPDLIVANYNDATVSVLIANADGSYKPRVNYTVGNNPVYVVTGDFNGDQKIDVVVVNSNCPTLPCSASGSFSTLLGNGDGTLQAHVDKTLGHFPSGAVAVDFNADKKLDLAISNSQDNTIAILQGNGDGTFRLLRNIATGVNPNGVIACICNKPSAGGFVDLVVADTGQNDVLWLRGNGNGTFQRPLFFSAGANPYFLVTGDYNSDGRPDVITANSGASTASVLINSSDGGFEPFIDYATSGPGTSITQGDFDNDGFIDVAVTSPTTDGVTTLRGLGNGTFASKIDYAAGLDPVAISAADYTGDGRTDLAVANDVDNTVSIIANTGGGLFNVRQGVTVGNMPNGIAVSDYNGDGVLDMAVADRGDNQVLLLRGNGDGTFTNANNPVTVGAKPSSIITVDLNKDGILDLVTTNASDNTVSVALGTGSGTFGAARSAKVGSRPVAVIARDFNTDGNMDLAVANQNTLTVSVLLGNGDGTFKAAKSYTTGPGTNPSWLDAGALSGTRLSIVVANNGTGTISVLLGNGDGTFTLPVQYTAGSGPSGIVLADLNGDGNLDAAVSNQTSNTVSVLTGNGNGTFNTHVDYAVPSNPFFVTTADLSGDGKVDLVVGSSNVNQNRVSILKGNGDGTFQIHQDHATKLNAGGPSEALGIGDFNGDGALDVAAADQVANTVDVLLNDATLAFSPQTINFGTLAIGQPSSPQPVTATNAGSAVISNLNVTSTGDFSETDTCPATLAIGASCTSQVTFTATQSGLRTGSLSFTDNAPSSPQNVALQGTGGGPGATLSQTQLTFPNTLIGMTSVKQVVNLTNTGSSNLTITSIASNSSQFSQTNTCPTTLLVNATCTITVTFKPTQTGQLTGAIVVTDNAFNSPQSVNLTGVGTEVKLNPIKLFFGNQAVGTSSTPQTVTLSNVGTVTLNVSSIAISGLNPNDYSQTNNCPTGLVGGASCTITVTFKPTAKGDRPATLAVTDDGGGSPQTVPLDGTGI